MKWFYCSLILSVLSAAAGATYVVRESRHLDSFCSNLPLGATVAEVRKAALKQGFDSSMEPYTQMRIKPRLWHEAPPSCRVFFNRDRTVEYRTLQQS